MNNEEEGRRIEYPMDTTEKDWRGQKGTVVRRKSIDSTTVRDMLMMSKRYTGYSIEVVENKGCTLCIKEIVIRQRPA